MRKLLATLLIGTSLSVMAGASLAKTVNIQIENQTKWELRVSPYIKRCLLNDGLNGGYKLISSNQEATLNGVEISDDLICGKDYSDGGGYKAFYIFDVYTNDGWRFVPAGQISEDNGTIIIKNY